MVKSADKERVRTLLKDTITLLIRNGLEFKTKFSIEALIGVTLDEDDIILVSINELVKSDLAAAAIKEKPAGSPSQSDGESSDGSVNADRSRNGRRKKRKRRKAPDIKSEQDPPGQGNDDDELDVKRNKPDESAAPTTVHDEEDDEEDHYDDHDEEGSDDLVFVKQEMDSWAQNTSSQSVDQTDPSMNFPALGDASLVPMSAGDDMWTQDEPGTSYQQSSTMTSETSMDPSMMQAAGFQPQCVDDLSAVARGTHRDEKHPEKVPDVKLMSCQHEGCSFKSKIKASVQRHYKTKHSGEISSKHPCDQCDKIYATNYSLSQHVKVVHGNCPFVCDACGQTFQSAGGLRGHQNIVHQKKLAFKCSLCHKGFYRRAHFEDHTRFYHQNKKYKCDKCDREYRAESSLITHKRTSCKGIPKSQMTRHQCTKCTSDFSCVRGLKEHIAVKHSDYVKMYICHCGKRFNRRQSNDRHVRKCTKFE